MSSLLPLHQLTYASEKERVDTLLAQVQSLPSAQISQQAAALITKTRAQSSLGTLLQRFLTTHQLSSPQGITVMCLAESLLRIPDSATASDLISEKMRLNPLLADLSVPIIRQGVNLLGGQFVLAEDIESALKQAQKLPQSRFSFDMLGEAAKTGQDAQTYFKAYADAIHAIGNFAQEKGPIISPGISVKLSALHPRYHYTQIERLQTELVPKLIELASLAKQYRIGFTIDAEEAERLQLSLILIEQVLTSSELNNWDGFGLAVQAYQKAAPAVLDFCADVAKKTRHRLMLRLVKGAYWDSEIKRAQEQGLAQYPVYTRKMTTDVSYLVCAQQLLKNPGVFYPQFATHNAFTIAAVLQMVGESREFEFQRLYGMGENLYNVVMKQENVACRVYAPIGNYQHLLAYLVRRLLENGANTSFVQQIENKQISIEELAASPIEKLAALQSKPHPDIPLPKDIYGDERENSRGFDLSDFKTKEEILIQLHSYAARNDGASNQEIIEQALQTADKAFPAWNIRSVNERANYLYKAADLLTAHQVALMSILIQEGHKTILDAQSEVREAIDYCRYYALEAEKLLTPQSLPGPTGEQNTLLLAGRGIAVCISPWNFPLAIFLGQIVAALATGNTVIAKPASNTPLIARYTVDLLHQAGIPKEVLQLLIGSSKTIGDVLMQDARVSLVVFTGSFETAQHINQTLAARNAPIAAFIAETGGQNAMIVDSSALLEQVVADVIASAFNSAGQRCSALRVLCIQQEIAQPLIHMLKGAMAELRVGPPHLLSIDVGPVIDQKAQQSLLDYINNKKDKILYQTSVPSDVDKHYFVPPTLIEIQTIEELTKEVFGPVLHVISYAYNNLPDLLRDLNNTGYGLTLGIHSRLESFANTIVDKTFVGNNYVNRNMIGAVVGVQPFGGQHLSGTGPKAGGPHYLSRFVTEKTLTVNTAALGGNISLLGLDDTKD